jgi:pseudo-rSAM protein
MHINIKNNTILLYNTLNGQHLVFDSNSAIIALMKRMISTKNLNAVIEERAILKEKNLQGFLETCINMQFINWYSYSKEVSHKKPVSLPAILNFHRDRRKISLDPERNPGQDILKYLHKLNIYINCYQGDHFDNLLFKEGYKQFLFPYSSNEYNELQLEGIQQLLDQLRTIGICDITVLGGNIFKYTEFDRLMTLLNQLPLKKELGIFYKDITIDNLKLVDWDKSKEIFLKIFVGPQMEKNQLINCIKLLKDFKVNSKYQFTIQSESDANDFEEVVDFLNENQFYVKAFHNGFNYKFFKENIFIEKGDLSEPVISKKDIYARSVMNPNSFGHITILCSGDVYSNLNERRIGTIDHGVKSLLLKELSEGRGWFTLRKDLSPCNNCVYHQICPPISNYEYALSRNNLCWLQHDKGYEINAD